MDDRIHIFFCILGGAAGFGLVGAVFGALARVLFQEHGKAAGGVFGTAAVQALEHARREELSERHAEYFRNNNDEELVTRAIGIVSEPGNVVEW